MLLFCSNYFKLACIGNDGCMSLIYYSAITFNTSNYLTYNSCSNEKIIWRNKVLLAFCLNFHLLIPIFWNILHLANGCGLLKLVKVSCFYFFSNFLTWYSVIALSVPFEFFAAQYSSFLTLLWILWSLFFILKMITLWSNHV